MASKSQLELEIKGLQDDLARAQSEKDAIFQAGKAMVEQSADTIRQLNDRITVIMGMLTKKQIELNDAKLAEAKAIKEREDLQAAIKHQHPNGDHKKK